MVFLLIVVAWAHWREEVEEVMLVVVVVVVVMDDADGISCVIGTDELFTFPHNNLNICVRIEREQQNASC